MFVAKIRELSEELPLNQAVSNAIDYWISHDILKDFLLRERKAVTMYSLYEYNQAGHMKVVREEGFEEGIEKGISNVNMLYSWLLSQGRSSDIEKAINDPEYLKKLQNEYAVFIKQK